VGSRGAVGQFTPLRLTAPREQLPEDALLNPRWLATPGTPDTPQKNDRVPSPTPDDGRPANSMTQGTGGNGRHSGRTRGVDLDSQDYWFAQG
jgi:hypothetical protein